jgi:hypothetical protein
MSRIRTALAITLSILAATAMLACGGGGGDSGGGGPPAETRTFLMGSTPFFGTPTAFPDWRFENLDDRDLLSVHVDDFWGVPWDQCNASGCTNLPADWVAKWQSFAASAQASGKTLYLAVSPLGDRKTLARSVQAGGALLDRWVPAAAVDADGCYKFAEDATNAATYKAAYISFLKYVIDLVKPKYFSPAIEMNMPFTSCPAQKAAWIAWYSDVHSAIKAAYPTLIVFPTFQMEYMYGVSDAQSACATGTAYSECFDQRLTEALAIPADRIAFSTYPAAWTYSSAFSYSHPTDTYTRVRRATSRKIWISETGWPAVWVRQSYAHGASGTCGADLYPSTLTIPGFGTVGLANDTRQSEYIAWLLGQAQSQQFDAVIWWLNRDYLDGTVAVTCPCDPATSDTCKMADLFHAVGSDFGEMMLRVFGNMALRNYDGSPRTGYTTWKQYRDRTYTP